MKVGGLVLCRGVKLGRDGTGSVFQRRMPGKRNRLPKFRGANYWRGVEHGIGHAVAGFMQNLWRVWDDSGLSARGSQGWGRLICSIC